MIIKTTNTNPLVGNPTSALVNNLFERLFFVSFTIKLLGMYVFNAANDVVFLQK